MRVYTGLDFDGPIHDIDHLKGLVAFKLFGLNIDGHLLNSDVVKEGKVPITLDQYRAVQRLIYSDDPEIIQLMQPTSGALDALSQLIQSGHQISIPTARKDTVLDVANAKLLQWGFRLNFHGIGHRVSKKEKIEELLLDNYVDDDLKVLEEARGVKANLFLFNPYTTSPYPDIEQVTNWPALLSRIN